MSDPTGRPAEIVPEGPNALADRLAQFREEAGSGPSGGSPTPPEREEEELEDGAGGDSEQDETPPDAGEEQPAGAEEERTPAGEEPEGEEEEGAEGAPKGEKLFTVDIPTLNADGSKGPHGRGVLSLEGLPQEYRDTIQSHVKRSQQLDVVQERLQELEVLAPIAQFVRDDPFNAMRHVYLERPEVAEQFVDQWMVQNPRATLAAVRRLKLDSADEGILKEKADLARQRMESEVDGAWQGLRERDTARAYTTTCHSVIRELVGDVPMRPRDYQDFRVLAEDRIVEAMETAKRQGRSPFVPRAELITALQPLVQRFVGKPPASSATGKARPGQPGKKLEDRARTADRFRQLKSGAAGTSAQRPTGVTKKLPRDLGERIKLMRAGKI